MIKHINKERVTIIIIITLLLDFPVIYWITIKLYSLINDFNLNTLFTNPSIYIYLFIMIFITNYMLHLIMESNFIYLDDDNEFIYKTLLWFRKKRISYKDVKMIIVCRENLVFNGDYESMIVIRKGLRRNIFFTEFSMKNDQYSKLKEFLTHIDPEKVVITKKRYIKPLLALFGK